MGEPRRDDVFGHEHVTSIDPPVGWRMLDWRELWSYRELLWVLTALTFMHVDDWKKVFAEVGYTGDYYWFIAE